MWGIWWVALFFFFCVLIMQIFLFNGLFPFLRNRFLSKSFLESFFLMRDPNLITYFYNAFDPRGQITMGYQPKLNWHDVHKGNIFVAWAEQIEFYQIGCNPFLRSSPRCKTYNLHNLQDKSIKIAKNTSERPEIIGNERAVV